MKGNYEICTKEGLEQGSTRRKGVGKFQKNMNKICITTCVNIVKTSETDFQVVDPCESKITEENKDSYPM